MANIETRIMRLESRHTGMGAAYVTCIDGQYQHNGLPITADELAEIEATHAFLIIRGDCKDGAVGITIRRQAIVTL